MKIGKLQTDREKEKAGVWVETGMDGLRLLIARTNNTGYKEYIRKNNKSLIAAARLGKMDLAEAERLNKVAAANHCVLGWEGLTEDDGTPIPFSPAKCLELFDKAPDFYDLCLGYANDMSLFQTQLKDDAQGNSGQS